MIPQDLVQPKLAVPRLRHAMDEAPERQPMRSAERARQGEVRQHGVDLVGGLVHLFEKDDRSPEGGKVRSRGRVMDQGQIAAQHPAGR